MWRCTVSQIYTRYVYQEMGLCYGNEQCSVAISYLSLNLYRILHS